MSMAFSVTPLKEWYFGPLIHPNITILILLIICNFFIANFLAVFFGDQTG